MAEIPYKELLARLSHEQGEKAFNELFRRLFSRLHGFAYSFLKSDTDAEEVVMDVFLTIWNNRHKLREVNNIETYLYVITRNLSVNRIKKNGKKVIEYRSDIMHIDSGRHEYTNTPEASLIGNEMIALLHKAINRLPPQCRIIFILIRLHGLPRKKVAEMLRISPKTIDAQIAIAVQRITRALCVELMLPE